MFFHVLQEKKAARAAPEGSSLFWDRPKIQNKAEAEALLALQRAQNDAANADAKALALQRAQDTGLAKKTEEQLHKCHDYAEILKVRIVSQK